MFSEFFCLRPLYVQYLRSTRPADRLASPITSSEENNITRRGILHSGNLVVFIQKRPEEFIKHLVFLQNLMHEICVFFFVTSARFLLEN
jgi:hypothetical protein